MINIGFNKLTNVICCNICVIFMNIGKGMETLQKSVKNPFILWKKHKYFHKYAKILTNTDKYCPTFRPIYVFIIDSICFYMRAKCPRI